METPLLLPALVRCRIEGKSPRTVQAYAWTLHRFLAALREEDAPFDPSHVRPEHVIAYLDRGSHLSLESRHRYFREVRCFFSWLVAPAIWRATRSGASATCACPKRSCSRFRRPRSHRSCAPAIRRPTPASAIAPSSWSSWIPACAAANASSSRSPIEISLPDGCAFGTAKATKNGSCRSPDAAGTPLPPTSISVAETRGLCSLPSIPVAGLPRRSRSRPTASNRCCVGWAGRPACPRSTPTASGTPSRPGPSSTMHASSTSSTCSGTAHPTWCGATRRRTTRRRRRTRTPPSAPRPACWAPQPPPNLGLPGKVSASQAEGRGFDPRLPLHFPPASPGTAVRESLASRLKSGVLRALSRLSWKSIGL